MAGKEDDRVKNGPERLRAVVATLVSAALAIPSALTYKSLRADIGLPRDGLPQFICALFVQTTFFRFLCVKHQEELLEAQKKVADAEF